MSQAEILDILDHPMTAKEISKVANLPLRRIKDNLTFMVKNKTVLVVGNVGMARIYQRAA